MRYLLLCLMLVGCVTAPQKQKFSCSELNSGMMEILNETRDRIVNRQNFFHENFEHLSAYQIKNIVRGQIKDTHIYMEIAYDFLQLSCTTQIQKEKIIKNYNFAKRIHTDNYNVLIQINEL